MSPPNSQGAYPVIREVTEDTPPDLLEGTMELLVVLPSTKTVRMTVDRKTPMMDILIQVGTVNKINPGDHIVQVRNERGFELPYKPSTPIGALDTTTIEIVPKSKVNEYIIVKKPAKLANQPFEHTFRLQVHLPRNQLYVMRVSMKTGLEDILKEVCQEKNLDILKYEIRHPVNLEQKLPLSGTLEDFGLHEVTVVSKNTKINSSVSSADIMALQQTDEGRAKGYMDSSFKHSRSSVGDSSVSSGSTGSARGLSPTRSDDSRSVSPLPQSLSKLNHRISNLSSSSSAINNNPVHKASSMSNMFSPLSNNRGETLPSGGAIQAPPRTKKRAAPPPPPLLKSQTESCLSIRSPQMTSTPIKPTPRKKEAPRLPPKSKTFDTSSSFQDHPQPNHSRHSSGSSGFNESLILSTHNEPHRFDRQISAPATMSKQAITTRSTSNLTTVSSVSSSSLASSTGGSKKRKAPAPPPAVIPFKPQLEIEEEDSETSSSVSHGLVSDKSVEVEVDVHQSDSKQRDNKNVIKEVELHNSSSSAASSLSSPASSSASTSSSPLPRTDSPNSKSALNNDNSSSKGFSSPTQSNYYPAEDEPRNPTSGSTQASAPLPPPRTKTREVLLASSLEKEEESSRPEPKPRPRPRPDRASVDNLIADNPIIIKPKAKEENAEAEQPAAPVMSSQLRNPMAKYGVKVLPDNVINERAERLAKKASLEADEFTNNKTETNKKPAAPTPPFPPSSAFKSSPKPKAPSVISTQKDSSHSEEKTLTKYPGKGKQKSSVSTEEYDSDNLEENLEFFEPSGKPPSAIKLVNRKSQHSSLTSATDSFDEFKSSISSQGSNEIKDKPKPKPKAKPTLPSKTSDELSPNKPLIMSSSVSDFKKVSETTDLPEGISSKEIGAFNRTSSDRYHKTKEKGEIVPDGHLNRWQNLVSLNEIDDISAKNASTNILPSEVSLKSSNFIKKSGRSSSPQDIHADAHILTVNHDDDDAGITSSESEVSYTDSGVPTTETITPSPMDFDGRISDHEDGESSPDHKKEIDSRRSSPRSSFHSDDGDHWRNVMESKAVKNEEAMEKTFASMIPETFGDNQKNSIEQYAKPSTEDSGAEDFDAHTSTSEEETKDIDSKSSSRRSSETKKLSKAESFSHNSEFDIVKMKRKKFGSGAGMKSNSKRGNSTTDLRSSHHSSSEEDLRSVNPPERYEEDLGNTNTNTATDTIREQRATSMHNLTASGSHLGGIKENGQHQRRLQDDELNNHGSIKKTTSLMEIQKLEPDVTGSPDIMKAFHSQLEAQFEQWKQDFLQKHMTGTNPDSIMPQQVEERSVKAKPTAELESDPLPIYQSGKEQNHEKSKQKEEFVVVQESFVKKPEILDAEIHESDFESEEPPSHIPTPPVVVAEIKQEIKQTIQQESSPISQKVNPESREMSETVEVREKRKVTATPQVYRYSGPPTINMGSWSERPRTMVSVKKDQDYIMGFGQVDSKSTVVDIKPAARPVSVSNFQGSSSTIYENPAAPAPIEINNKPSVTFLSNNKTSSLPYPKKGLSATLNVRPVPSESSESTTSSVKSVLSTWKMRVSENENKEKKNNSQGPPPEIDIYGNENESITERKEPQPIVKSATIGYKMDSKGPAKVILESKSDQVDSMSFTASKSIFNKSNKQQVADNPEENKSFVSSDSPKNTSAVTINNNNGIKKQNSFNVQTSFGGVKAEPKITNIMESKPAKPMLFKMNTMEVKPVSRVQSFNVPITKTQENNQTSQKLQEQSSLNDDEPVQSLQEKKKYFQGIKPVEKNGKEAPMPAVNMKGSIATIQKVFEQRQQLQRNPASSPVQRSMTLPTHSAIQTTATTIIETEPSPPVISQQQVSSSTMPKHFQSLSSNEMVSKVLGRPVGYNYEAFRRSPSPVSSTTSTLSRTSSSGRGTPSSTITEGQETVVKISQEYKKSAPPPPNNIQNVDNKAIIIVNGSKYSANSNDGEIKHANNVSGNIFKLNMKVNANSSSENNSNFSSPNNRKNSSEINSTKIVINGSPIKRLSQASVKIPESTPAETNVSETPIIIKDSKRPSIKSPPVINIIPKQSDTENKNNNNGVSPPPPPPPSMDGLNKLKPKDLAINNESLPKSASNSKVSTPTSPSSDPRSDIFNAIKNSNGNFGLKKTGSTFLLK